MTKKSFKSIFRTIKNMLRMRVLQGLLALLFLFVIFFKKMDIYSLKDWLLLIVALSVVIFFIIKIKEKSKKYKSN